MQTFISQALILSFAALPTALGQSSPNCPFLGPVFPPPNDVLTKSTAVPKGFSQLNETLQAYEKNGTLAEFNTTISFQVFSSTEKLFSYGYVPPSMTDFLTSKSLDGDTVFRIGSVSKLLTVYTLLAEVGMNHIYDPVTKWVPELEAATQSSEQSPAQRVQWNDVTIGQLAGHMAGLERDFNLNDFSDVLKIQGVNPELVGFPELKRDEIPTCGILTGRPCSRKQFYDGITALHPLTSTSHTPIYSNFAFEILAHALEGMTNRTFAESIEKSLLEPLGLKRTTLEHPNSTENAIIPESEAASTWNITMEDATAYGGMFSTTNDLTLLIQSILNSTILPPSLTRAWLKPITHTASAFYSVGMSWEIQRMLVPLSPGSTNTRIVDLYTKNGVLGSYNSVIAMSPDHDFGFVVMLARAEATTPMSLLSVLPNLLAEALVPAFEEAAREQAEKRFVGQYESENTTLTVGVDEGLPGLAVRNLTSRGVDMLDSGLPGVPVSTLRLYPMDLEGGGKLPFRGVYGTEGESADATYAGPFISKCVAWGGADTPKYGNAGLDAFEFDVEEDGKVVGITARALRESLKKTA